MGKIPCGIDAGVFTNFMHAVSKILVVVSPFVLPDPEHIGHSAGYSSCGEAEHIGHSAGYSPCGVAQHICYPAGYYPCGVAEHMTVQGEAYYSSSNNDTSTSTAQHHERNKPPTPSPHRTTRQLQQQRHSTTRGTTTSPPPTIVNLTTNINNNGNFTGQQLQRTLPGRLVALDAPTACSGRSLAALPVAAALLDTRLRAPRLRLYPRGDALTLARCTGPVGAQSPPWWGCWAFYSDRAAPGIATPHGGGCTQVLTNLVGCHPLWQCRVRLRSGAELPYLR